MILPKKMGLYDIIKLIEPLPCFACYSTSDDKTEEWLQKSNIQIGDQKLQVMRLHDGTGGIKTFQTKDLGRSLKEHLFPGFLHVDILGSGNLSDGELLEKVIGESFQGPHEEKKEMDIENPWPIDLIEICNICNSTWYGDLHLKYERTDNIYITDYIEIWPRGEGGEEKAEEDSDLNIITRIEETPFYNLSFSEKKIKIEPRIDNVIEHYNKKSKEFQLKSKTYREMLNSLNDDKALRERIILCLEKETNVVPHEYDNKGLRPL